jgi:hypothetical protein
MPQGHRLTFKTGPCPFCRRAIIGDEARGSISHEEPVCGAFEKEMLEQLGHRGKAEVMDRKLGVLVPDFERQRRARN